MIRSIDRTRLVNLKVVASLKRGQKLKTRMQYFEIDDSSTYYLPQWLYRGYYEESRVQTLFSLSDLITSCTNVSLLKKEEIPLIIDELLNASGGICNLISTYNNHITTVSDLILTLQQIFGFIKKHGTYENELALKRKCSVLETIVPESLLPLIVHFRSELIEEEVEIDNQLKENDKEDEDEVTVDHIVDKESDIEVGEVSKEKDKKKSKNKHRTV